MLLFHVRHTYTRAHASAHASSPDPNACRHTCSHPGVLGFVSTVLGPAACGFDVWQKRGQSCCSSVAWYVQIHAEGEAGHAAIGHGAVLSFVPAEHESTLRRAMCDHDRDFSAFYNKLADMLQ